MATLPRVLHVTTTIERGGAENYLIDLVRGQVDAGYPAIACAYLKGGDYWAAWLRTAGIDLLNMRMSFYGDPLAALRLGRLVRKFRPDVIHVHGAPAEVYAWCSRGLASKTALIITRHEHRERLFSRPGYDAMDRIISRSVDQIISVSESVRADDVRRRPILKEKNVVIHHGIRTDFCDEGGVDRHEIRAELGARSDDILIGSVARLAPEKSLATLLRSFRICLDRAGETASLRLALIGRGPLENELRRLADELGISDRVVFAGFREDVPAVMKALDIFVLPSLDEGFGLAVIEAMSCCRPVVASRVSALPEIVEEGHTGFLAEPGDPKSFAEHIGKLVQSSELRERLGRVGKERAAARFSLEQMRSKTHEVYIAALHSCGDR